MPTLIPANEFDEMYFDGGKTPYSRNGGYQNYKKWYRINDDWVPHAESSGEYWHDMALWLIKTYDLRGKKVLDLGCAKGFTVEGLRDEGIDAWGFDVSSYAISQAREDIKPYLIQGDMRTDLTQFGTNEFDLVYSRWTLECIAPEEVPVKELNRIAKHQVHSIHENIQPEYYTRQPIEEWLKLDWAKGTELTSHSHFKNIITK